MRMEQMQEKIEYFRKREENYRKGHKELQKLIQKRDSPSIPKDYRVPKAYNFQLYLLANRSPELKDDVLRSWSQSK